MARKVADRTPEEAAASKARKAHDNQRDRERRKRKRQEAIAQAVQEASTRVVPTITSTHGEIPEYTMASSLKISCIQSWSIPPTPPTELRTKAVSIDGTRKRVKIEDEDEDDSQPQPEPSNGASIVNGADQEQHLVPYLLNNKRLRFTEGGNESSVRSVLLFPKSLDIFKAGADAVFSINRNPSSVDEESLPLALARSVYEQHLLHNNPDHPLKPSELPPHVRVGSTSALGFPLHFYIMFVKEEPAVTSPDPHRAARKVFIDYRWNSRRRKTSDHVPGEYHRHWATECIFPALRCNAVKKYALRRRTGTEREGMSEPSDEDNEADYIDDIRGDRDREVSLEGLDAFWDALTSGEEAKSSYGIDDALLIAYGDSKSTSSDGDAESTSNSAMWSDFQRRWDQNFDDSKLWQGFTKISLTADFCW